MQSRKIGHEEIFNFDRLERAFDSLHLEMTEENETTLFNLHNHLVWHSFIPGKDPVADAILSYVIADLLEEYDLDASCVPAEFRDIASSVVERRYSADGQSGNA